MLRIIKIMNETIHDNHESSESEEFGPTLLWGIGGCCLATFGTALIGTMLYVNDPQKLFKIAVGVSMMLGGAAFCGAGILIARYGTFAQPRAPSTVRHEDVNEMTPFVAIENKM